MSFTYHWSSLKDFCPFILGCISVPMLGVNFIVWTSTQLKVSVSCPKGNYENENSPLKTYYLLEFLYKATTGIQGEEQYPFCMQKEKWRDAGNAPYQLRSSPHTGLICPRPFIWSSYAERTRKEGSNNFPRHRRELEMKFNLSELYCHQFDWFGEWIEQISLWLRGSGDNLISDYTSKTSGGKSIQWILSKIQPASHLDVLVSLLVVWEDHWLNSEILLV